MYIEHRAKSLGLRFKTSCVNSMPYALSPMRDDLEDFMPYTSELKELIKKVEATRPARVERKKRGEEFPMLSLKEREERLRKYPSRFQRGFEERDPGGSEQGLCDLS